MNNNSYQLTDQDGTVLPGERSPDLGQLCKLLGIGLREPKSVSIFVEGLRVIERRVLKAGLPTSYECSQDFLKDLDLLYEIPYWYGKSATNDDILGKFQALRTDIHLKCFKKGIRRALFKFYGTDGDASSYIIPEGFLGPLTILLDLLDELE